MYFFQSARVYLAPQFMTHMLGVCASFYLGFNLVLGGGVAEIPVVFVSLVALMFFRPSDAALYEGFKLRIFWATLLLGFSLFNCFMVWFHAGEIELYEPYAKLLVGSLVAFAFAYHRINLVYIRAGLYLAAVSLIYLYFYEYSGHGRYSAGMNPNKWSPMLLSYAVVALVFVLFDKSRLFKVIAFVAWSVFAGMILIAGSRSTSLLLGLVSICFLLFMTLRSPSSIRVLTLIAFILTSFVLYGSAGSLFKSKMVYLSNEISAASQLDHFTSSNGLRFIMWKSGLSSVKGNVYIGSGYDLAKSISDYEPDSKGEEKAIKVLKKYYGSFHNIWVDTVVTQGVIGLVVLLSFFIISLILVYKNRALLMLGPLIAVGLNGLTESTLYMSILAGHLALAGAIFMNIDEKLQT